MRFQKPVMSLRPFSALSDNEIYACMFYYYYISAICKDDLSGKEFEDFMWDAVSHFHLEDKLDEILNRYIEYALAERDICFLSDFDIKRFFNRSKIPYKYDIDHLIEDTIPITKTRSETLINYYRLNHFCDAKNIVFLELFFGGAVTEDCEITKIYSGRKKKYLRKAKFFDADEADYGGEGECSWFKMLEIDRAKLPEKIKHAINNLSDVRFLIKDAGLTKAEAKILLFLYRLETIKPLYECFSKNMNCFDFVAQKLFEIDEFEYSNLMKKSGKLKSNGFLDEDGFIEDDLKSCIKKRSMDSFFSDLVQDLDCSNSYGLSSFSVPEENSKIMKHFLNGKMNSSILLYGMPGSGKTEFAKALVKACGKNALIFKNENELLDTPKAVVRLNCYLSMKNKDSILIIDEADKLLQTKDMTSFVPNSMKGTVNKMLENSKYKTIWIVNYSNQIDVSTKRRFSYSYKFEPMSDRLLRSIAETKLNPLGLEKGTQSKVLELLDKYRVTGSSVENVAGIIQEMKSLETEEMLFTVDSVLKENEILVSGKKKMRQNVTGKYDLSVLNTSVSASKIVQMTENALLYAERHPAERNGIRMLFYGLSGTGKTELARYISEKLGKNILLKRASDILGKYVGETEGNIRDAFEEAECTGTVLLFDEADSFFADRKFAQHSWERTQVNEFLTQMEEFSGILICTTNLRKIMDEAMLRRFHICVEFKPLMPEGIQILLEKYFGGFKFSESEVEALYHLESVTPGDFNVISSRIRFMNPEEVNKEYIVRELTVLQQEKNGSAAFRKIGFGA